MAVVLGTSSGFVLIAPTADPAGTNTTIDGSSVVTKDTSPAGAALIIEIGWYRGSGANTANFEVGLYDQSAGVANTRLQVANTNSSSVQGWIRVPVSWSISAATAYWLAVQMDAHSGSSTIDTGTPGGSGSDVLTSQTTLNNPYGGGAVADASGMYAIYALLQADASITGVIAAATAAGAAGTVVATADAVITGAAATATAAGRVGVLSIPISAGFEQGTDGATVATTDPGDGTPWNVVSIGAGNTVTYDATRSAHGNQSVKVAYGSANFNTELEWVAAFGTRFEHFGRVYVYFTAAPPTNAAVFVDSRSGSTLAAALQITLTANGRKLRLLDSAFGSTDSTNAIPLNQWIRIEWHFVHNTSTGSLEAKIFDSPDADTPLETVTRNNVNTLASVDRIWFGSSNVNNGFTFWQDSILAGVGSYPGPDTTPILRLVQGNAAAASAAAAAGDVSIVNGSADANIAGAIATATAAGVAGDVRFDANITAVAATATAAGAAGTPAVQPSGTTAAATAAGTTGAVRTDDVFAGVRAAATATTAPGSVTIAKQLDGNQATATAAGVSGTTRNDFAVTGVVAAATAAGQGGSIGAATLVNGATATAAAAAAGSLLASTFPAGTTAAAAAAGTNGSVQADQNIAGVRATAAAAGQPGTVFAGNTINIAGVQATATATGTAGSLTLSYILDGSQATATATTAAGELLITSVLPGSSAYATATALAGETFGGTAGHPIVTGHTHARLASSGVYATATRPGQTNVQVGSSHTHAEEGVHAGT